MESKVTVKIYGQDYIIAGEKPAEEIKKIGEFVDNKMKLIGKVTSNYSAGGIAILSAINITEEYFDALAQNEHLKTAKNQLETDAKYYLKMWEEAKKNSIQFKENMTEMKNQKKENEEKFNELEKKCSEYESSFFDLQMENIQLKSELEKLKNNR